MNAPINAPVNVPGASSHAHDVRALARRRWLVALALTVAMVACYFGFIGLVAWRPDLLATPVGDGLTAGIVLGALVIVAAWVLTLVYVRWANRVYDVALETLRAKGHR